MNWVHVYRCPECDLCFTADHPDVEAYMDPCPGCGHDDPDLVDLFRPGDEDIGA